MFIFLDSKLGDRGFWTDWWQAFPELSALNFFIYVILIFCGCTHIF